MLYRTHGEWVGTEFQRWGDKTPINVGWMDEIVAVFPDARFVFMQRDGVDVVHSHMNALENSMTKAARTWKQSVQFLEEFRQNYSNPCRVVRYEEFVARPEEETEELCDFLGITFSPALVEADRSSGPSDLQRVDHHRRALKPITEDRVGAGHRALSANEKQLLKDLIGAELREWGYSISV
jgi:superfamily I DNA/RNA helicase